MRASPRRWLVPLLVLGSLLVWIGGAALVLESARLGKHGAGKVAVLYWPPSSAETVFRRIIAAGGAPVRPVLGSLLWIAHSDEAGFVGRLRAHGAVAAFAELDFGPAFVGCFAFPPRVKTPRPAINP